MLPVRSVFQAAQVHMPALLQACRHLSSAAAASNKVGFIGLGHMVSVWIAASANCARNAAAGAHDVLLCSTTRAQGNRMVQRLLGAGHEVVAYDSNRLALSRASEVAKQQGKGSLETRTAPQDLVQDEDVGIIFTMLPNQSAVLKAYLGDQGLLKEGEKSGTSLFVDW
jgi:3-hydroxyisobutyrate dehydrogenase-like beta-hydroxyacid dehydrogenase